MGKAARQKKSRKQGSAEPIPTRPASNWPLCAPALVGMGLTAYLTFSSWSGETVAGCSEGSGCDVVLSSRWSKLFGLPTSLWGLLAYTALAGIAFIKRSDLHWKLAWAASLFGFFYSLYLTGVSVFALQATCPYCLSSLALMTAILALVAYQRPATLAGFSWSPWLLRTVSGALALLIVLHLHYAGILGEPARAEDPWVRGLAEHLVKSDAKFYGASWCPHCTDQKELFGSSAPRLPYIECSPQGRGRPQARACNEAGIKSYPTWIIKGERHVGTLSLDDLARYSQFNGERR